MKKYYSVKTLWKALLCFLAVLSLIIDLSSLFVKTDASGESLIKSASIWVNGVDYAGVICLATALSVIFCIGCAAFAIILTLLSKRSVLYPYALPFILHVGFFVVDLSVKYLSGFGRFLIVFAAILNLVSLVCSLVYSIVFKDKDTQEEEGTGSHRQFLVLLCGVLGTLVTISLLFTPFCSYEDKLGDLQYVIPTGVLSASANEPLHLVLFFMTFAVAICSFVSLMSCFRAYSDDISKLADRVTTTLALGFGTTGTYFVSAVAFASINNSKGGAYYVNCFWPIVILIAVALLHCLCVRRINISDQQARLKACVGARIEFFIYSLLISACAVGACLSDILKVSSPSGLFNTIRVNGLVILKNYNSIEAGLQLIAFLILGVLVCTAALFLASLLSLVSGSKLFYKITLASSVCGISSAFFIGLFGKYYEIVQKMNVEMLKNIISSVHGTQLANTAFKVQSQSFYWFLIAVAVMCIIILRRPYSKGEMNEMLLQVSAAPAPDDQQKEKAEEKAGEKIPENAPKLPANVDPCPALTLIDKQLQVLEKQMSEDKAHEFDQPTLPALVNFVVDYAKNSRLHLFYTAKDIATFIAGLGATRLTILQGMSGTGKTSLPKIFTEAVFGACEIVEVESSWRDKNELLGYYNEFSRTYTPKKFTQALYKARLCPDRLTFIVLDEMNLSRIEYYFSDFLSLMENEEDKREIKLLNVALFRKEDEKTYKYLGLEDGHTLKVPKNVWFIGTANRDESTFEISDKVYDRAHTMNFNKRAKKIIVSAEAFDPKFISAEQFNTLLNEAKRTVKFDVDSSPIVREVEELLAPYNISFGNRIANQIEDFVSIYCSCFADPYTQVDEALETILLSKVVSKLELRSVDNKDALATEFSRLGLERCSEFIRALHED